MRWKTGLLLIVIIAIGGGGYFAWQQLKPAGLPPGFASSNGRLEAERTDIATKFAGRIKQVLVNEGDVVKVGQILARMDSADIEAQLLEARAATEEAEQQLDQAVAFLSQRKSELTLAEQEYERSRILGEKGYTTLEKVDQRNAARLAAQATFKSAEAGIKRAKAGIKAAAARVSRLEENLKDYVLTTPVSGRVQYRLAQPGEVVGAGGKIVTILDLSDVYMTIFLPTRDAGKLEIGAQARIVPDAASQYVVPANVSFVASDAQFTPKYVETANEREKLMFKVKLRLPPEVLKKYAKRVKAGITGVGYVRLSPTAKWPENLKVKLPEIQSSTND
ncbi:HlyD-like membrane fusion protein YhiI [hydrothermal vent metagenome]|uniref:HlyD-like membrane fusion protein YhiI n=1 Tax=hydrothermal vent metagenome TaxID=652676 RepID=A0A3B0RH74_9ZZZZ